MPDGLNRRELLQGAVAGAVVAGVGAGSTARAAGKLPQRKLGKTGLTVPILGYGTAPTGVKRELKDAIELYNYAIDQGVTYMDTAPEFTGYGQAQVQLGHVLKERRQEVFLVTKCHEPRGDKARQLLEKSLKELQTDHADLVYAHSIGADKMDLETLMGKDGVMQMLIQAKQEGLVRHIGISGHNRPWKFLKVLEEYGDEIEVMMNACNMASRYTYAFETRVWPVASGKNIGLVAMKVFAGMGGKQPLSSRVMPDEHLPLAIRYAWSRPNVASAVIGMATKEEIDQNVASAHAYQPLTAVEQQQVARIGMALAKKWGPNFGAVT